MTTPSEQRAYINRRLSDMRTGQTSRIYGATVTRTGFMEWTVIDVDGNVHSENATYHILSGLHSDGRTVRKAIGR